MEVGVTGQKGNPGGNQVLIEIPKMVSELQMMSWVHRGVNQLMQRVTTKSTPPLAGQNDRVLIRGIMGAGTMAILLITQVPKAGEFMMIIMEVVTWKSIILILQWTGIEIFPRPERPLLAGMHLSIMILLFHDEHLIGLVQIQLILSDHQYMTGLGIMTTVMEALSQTGLQMTRPVIMITETEVHSEGRPHTDQDTTIGGIGLQVTWIGLHKGVAALHMSGEGIRIIEK